MAGMCILYPNGSFAQNMPVKSVNSDTGRVMSLYDCMEYAVSNSTKMRIMQAEANDARIDRRNAILNAFSPSVSGSSYAYYNFGRSIDPETNTYKSTTSFQNGYSVGGNISIFNGFEAINNIKITKTAESMGISREQQSRDEICLAVMEAYYNVLYYKAMSDAFKIQTESARESVRKAGIEERLGRKGYADVVQMEADLADYEYNFINMQNMYNDALLTLQDLMFWPLEQPLNIDFSLSSDSAIARELAAVYGTLQRYDSDKIIENALTFLPQVAIAKGEAENAKRELNTAKWRLLPSLLLQGGWSTSYFTYPGEHGYKATPFWNQFSNNGGEYIQLSLSIPIFNRLSRQSDISKKKNAYIKATAGYDRTVREIETEAKRALQDRHGAVAAFVQACKKAQVQQEAYKYNTRKFEQGLISPIEYNTASGNYMNANAERLNALFKYYLKRSVVEYYNGVSYLEQYR